MSPVGSGRVHAFVLALLLAACGGEDIVVATIPASEAGAPALPPRCASDADCPTGSFCSKTSCDETPGVCEVFPAMCPNEELPVCGCDRVTYFNDCLRRAAGIAASTQGPCTFGAQRCNPSENPSSTTPECPRGTRCVSLLGFSRMGGCPRDAPGTCWVVPAECPPPSATDRWNECGAGPRCVDTCTAVSKGGIYERAAMCP